MSRIDREQAIDSICINICGKSHNNCGFWKKRFEFCGACEFAFLVGGTPSAEKIGKWINYKDEHRCSCCGEVVTGDWFYEDDAYSYCPNCGADMREVDNHETTD